MKPINPVRTAGYSSLSGTPRAGGSPRGAASSKSRVLLATLVLAAVALLLAAAHFEQNLLKAKHTCDCAALPTPVASPPTPTPTTTTWTPAEPSAQQASQARAEPNALPTQPAAARTGLKARALHAHLAQLTWPPLLSEEEARHGVSYYGSGAGLHCVAAKLLAGQPITLAAIGGSVTAAGGTDPAGQAYIARLFQWINGTFPHSGHTLYNKGMGAWNSGNFEPCLERIVPPADLLVVEFAINDATLQLPEVSYDSPERRAYETVLRRLLRLSQPPALLLLQAYPWWQAFGEGATQGLFQRQPEGELTTLAQYYDIPSVSLRAAAWRLMHEGVAGFRVDRVHVEPNRNFGQPAQLVPLADPAERERFFYLDSVHPAPHGLRVLAELLIEPLRRAVLEVAAGEVPERRADARLQGLPPPMIPNLPELSSSQCFMLEDFAPLVKAHAGFEYKAERPFAPNFVAQKWGWSGLLPGDWAELELDTALEPAKPEQKTTIYLTYLMSWRDMGTARVACTAGCACTPTDIDAQEPKGVSVFLNRLIVATQHPQCRLRVQILDVPKQSPQELRKFMIAAVMLRSGQGTLAQ